MMLVQTPRAKAIAERKMNGEYVNPHAVEQSMSLPVLETPRLFRKRSLSSYVWGGCVFVVFHPVATVAVVASLLPKFCEMVRVLAGGTVSKEEREDRRAICNVCDSCQRMVYRRTGQIVVGPDYCGSCGCWKWLLARLSLKNRLRKWECPRGRHKQTIYRIDPFIEFAEKAGYATSAADWKYEKAGKPQQRRSCGG